MRLHRTRPCRCRCVGFQRVLLKAGETKTVEIEVPVAKLRRWDEQADRYVVDSATWQIAVGPASDQPLLKAILTVSEPSLPAKEPSANQ
jgi:beta-glucosidase